MFSHHRDLRFYGGMGSSGAVRLQPQVLYLAEVNRRGLGLLSLELAFVNPCGLNIK